jgi:hypothetical protein
MINPVTQVSKSKRMIHVDSKSSRRTIKSRVTVSRDLEKYFKHLTFYSKYDEEITTQKSILNIPALSIVLPVAWITGSDVYVNEVDHTFAESMIALQQEYKKMYPLAPFKTRLITETFVENKPSPDGAALLFSGGVDSTYSLFSNMHLNPRLVMIFGVWDTPLKNVELLDSIERVYRGFAAKEGFKLNIIRTNALEMLDVGRIEHFFWRFDYGLANGFWMGLGFSLGHIGQVAPLSVRRFKRLLVSGGGSSPYASVYNTNEKMGWTNLHVKHLPEIYRYEKIFALKKYQNNHRITLRVCGFPERLTSNSLNCNRCIKCLITIIPLVNAGIDPNEVGFKVDNKTWKRFKSLFEKKKINNRVLKHVWMPFQKIIPEKIEMDLYGSKKFLKWLKTVDLSMFEQTSNNPLSVLYFRSPYKLSHALSKRFYDKHRNR